MWIPLVLVLGLLAPRLVLLALWFFTDLLDRAYATILWPLLGLIFLPFTTLAYAFAANAGGVEGIWIVVMVVAVLADLGAFRGWRRKRRD